MFRIAVLSEENEELIKFSQDASFISDVDASIMNILEDNEKLSILESSCMKRYGMLLREAADELVMHGILNDF